MNIYTEEAVELLEKLTARFRSNAENFILLEAENNLTEYCVAGIYGKMLQLSDAMITLYRSQPKPSIHILFRSFMECSAHLKNVVTQDDPELYLNKLTYDRVLSAISTIKSMIENEKESDSKQSKHFKKATTMLDEHIEFKNELEAKIDAAINPNKELSSNQLKNKRRLKIIEAFDQADMLGDYDLMFRFTSGEVHVSPQNFDRFIENTGETLSFKLYDEKEYGSFTPTFGHAGTILYNSTLLVQDYFKFTDKVDNSDLFAETNELGKRLSRP